MRVNTEAIWKLLHGICACISSRSLLHGPIDRESPGVVTMEFEFRALYIYILCYPVCGDEIDLSVQQRDTGWTAVIRFPVLKLLHCIALILKEAKICMYS